MKIAVFGYGSLVNSKSLSLTLGKNPDIKPAMLIGWKRDWSAILENISSRSHYVLFPSGRIPGHVAVLNIKPSESPEAQVNGILIECSTEDLEGLVNREVHYSVIDLTENIKDRYDYDKIYSFTAKPEFTDTGDTEAIIPSSYSDLVKEGFKSLGQPHLDTYVDTTRASSHKLAHTTFVVV